MLLLGGATACPAQEVGALAGTDWVLVALDGAPPAVAAADQPITIRFADDDRVSGTSGCNRFIGGYTTDGRTITLSQLATTRMACPSPLMELEDRVLQALSVPMRIVDGEPGTLELSGGADGPRLVFEPVLPE